MATGKPGVEALFKMGCSKRKIVNFPYWVELPRQLQGNRVEEGHTLIFFSVGQLIKRKGFNISLMAFRKALDKNNSKDVLYWIFGDGPERKNLENLSEELGLEQNVRFWGWREPKFIMGKLKNAHVLVHPALWEAYGVVVLEAMSYGKPVLGSSSTMGAVDRINDDENGFIHETGNIDQLSDQISLLIRDPEKINKFGESARSVAEEWPVENGVRIIKTKIIFDDKIAH
jgi:glycosyltransferase involved in cell wall biosynthesis